MSTDIVVSGKGKGKKGGGKSWASSNVALGVTSLATHALILGANRGGPGVAIPGTSAVMPAEGVAVATGALTMLIGGKKYRKVGIGQIIGAAHAAVTRGAMSRIKVTTTAGSTVVEAS